MKIDFASAIIFTVRVVGGERYFFLFSFFSICFTISWHVRASYDERQESLNQFDLFRAFLLILIKSVLGYFYAQAFPINRIRTVEAILMVGKFFAYLKKILIFLFCKIQQLPYTILVFFLLIEVKLSIKVP